MRYRSHRIEGNTVYPVFVRYRGNRHLILYAYSDPDDTVISDECGGILSFSSEEDAERYCQIRGLLLENDHSFPEYDFDAPIENPIVYTSVLNNWNLLNTIARRLGMFFEGDRARYNGLYDLLFSLSLPAEPIPPTYDVGEMNLAELHRVFRKKDRFLSRFVSYRGGADSAEGS